MKQKDINTWVHLLSKAKTDQLSNAVNALGYI
jgi:hypothetical protein